MTYQKITIPLDHGNRNMKTAEEVFTSGLVESDLKPVLGEYLQYNGKYYSLTGERIPYMRDKTLDDRFFILTLFGIGKELEKRTQPQKDTIYQVGKRIICTGTGGIPLPGNVVCIPVGCKLSGFELWSYGSSCS